MAQDENAESNSPVAGAPSDSAVPEIINDHRDQNEGEHSPEHLAHDMHNAHTLNEASGGHAAGGSESAGEGSSAAGENGVGENGVGGNGVEGPHDPRLDSNIPTDGGKPSAEAGGSGSSSPGAGTSGPGDNSGGYFGNGPIAGVDSGDVVNEAGAQGAGASAATQGAAEHGAVAAGGGGLAAGIVNGANMAAFAAIQVVKYIGKSLGVAGSRISEATGGRVSSMAAGGGVAGVLSMVLGMLFVPAMLGGPNTVMMDDVDDDNACKANVQNAATAAGLDNVGGGAGEISAKKEEVAKKSATVLRKFGMSDIEIAGAFGNMEQESGIDPTSVQGFPTSTYTMTEEKKAAAIARANGGGIGLIQWTPENPRLRAYAEKNGKDWWDLDIQLKYLTSESEWPGDMKAIIAERPKTLEAAMKSWLDNVEKAGKPEEGRRIAEGRKWVAKIANWNENNAWAENDAYASSIIAQASTGIANAGQEGVSAALANCKSSQGTNADNSSLAQAAVSYAWPFYDQSVNDIVKGQNNRGTPLYQNLHYAIWGSNDYGTHPLSSCDNGVSTAVQWSGADENMPEQSSDTMRDYLDTGGTVSGTWKALGWNNDVKMLQPGDILSTHGHILMYVGHDTVMKFYNNDQSKFEEQGDMVSASHTGNGGAITPNKVDRSPGVGRTQYGTPYYTTAKGYEAFRLQKATGSKFQNFKPSSTAVDLKPFEGGTAKTSFR